jgi:hypothetical protein
MRGNNHKSVKDLIRAWCEFRGSYSTVTFWPTEYEGGLPPEEEATVICRSFLSLKVKVG